MMGMLIATGVPVMPVVAQPSLLGRGYTPYLNQDAAPLRWPNRVVARDADRTTSPPFTSVPSNT
jgi:hypothetical protein